MTPILLLCCAIIVYHYAGYPAFVLLIARLRPAPQPHRFSPEDDEWPRVALIIAAYNEQVVIERKLRNSLALRYPGQLEIIVVSDGSSDATAQIVGMFAEHGVRSLHSPERKGKVAALNRGVAATTADILVFSDANNDFSEDALVHLVAPMADPSVGGVCGMKQIRSGEDRDSSTGDGLYWKYESAIKAAESAIDSITNADGEIFAVRRSLWKPIAPHIINDDAQITIDITRQGQRVLYERNAVSTESASILIADDFYVKVRMVAGGVQTIADNWKYLIPPRNWFTFSFFSHKVLRYLMPIFLIGTFTLTAALSAGGGPFFSAFLVLQLLFYAMAGAGWWMLRHGKRPMPLYVPFYFCAMNTAALMGLIRHFRRTQGVNWRKAQR